MALAIRVAAADATKEEAVPDHLATSNHNCQVAGPYAVTATAAAVEVPVSTTSGRKQTQEFKHTGR